MIILINKVIIMTLSVMYYRDYHSSLQVLVYVIVSVYCHYYKSISLTITLSISISMNICISTSDYL